MSRDGVSYTGSRLIGDPPERRVRMVWDQKLYVVRLYFGKFKK
jgi:hypothetical protein